MKSHVSISIKCAAVHASLFAVALFSGNALAGSSGEVVLPKAELKFEHLNPAIQMAAAYGDRSKSAHGTFGKFPGKFITPFHTHSGAYHGVVLKGVMTNPFKGQSNPPKMEPGSYWHVPANSVHATACVSDTPCEFYFHAARGFDFHPVAQ
ncbi:MAG: cupin domain-containing protein [Alphaproteobacteria bacterium]|nr:cupin domain-containing protein [Alphaproteobacteria bacterium]